MRSGLSYGMLWRNHGHLCFGVLVLLLSNFRAISGGGNDAPAGPMIGHVTSRTALIWARLPAPESIGSCRLIVSSADGAEVSKWNSQAKSVHDWCVRWKVSGLRPGNDYHYRIKQDGNLLFGGKQLKFSTPHDPAEPTIVKLAFGSCANEDEGTRDVFKQVLKTESDVMVLLGDTPYIDKTDLATQRTRHREFLDADGLRELARQIPVYGTWDDHDFGASNADGKLEGKEWSRQAFTEYRGNPSSGDGETGIYTNFRRGPVEVFILDTRYFANTEISRLVDGAQSMLGAHQWKWLSESLLSSTAPVKILACGAVWYDLPEGKPDCWARYAAERDAIFRWIGENGIMGVVLVSGDVHQSRVVEHPTGVSAGYPITEFVSSPMHHQLSPDANTPHPGLIKHLDVPNIFLQLEVDTISDAGTIIGRFIDKSGKVWHEEILAVTLLQKGD
jgi:alkaline phosphatase D